MNRLVRLLTRIVPRIVPSFVTGLGAAITFLALLAAGPAAAQPSPATSAASTPSAGTQALGSHLAAGHTLDRYLQNLRTEFRRLDADGNGQIDGADVSAHDAETAARARAMLSLAEGKNVITLPEIEVNAQALFRGVDTDGNGTVSQEELESHRRRSADPAAAPPR
jgi:hypothetical protein